MKLHKKNDPSARPSRKRLWTLMALCAASASAIVPARAGDVSFDFNTDPTGSALQTFLNATWVPSGGAGASTNANDGYLSITDAVNSQAGVIVFNDIDQGKVIEAFTFEADVRIGGGTDTPADGFSINYARAEDPVLDAAAQGFPSGLAGFGKNPGGDTNLPEEGTTTGLAICFDAYDNGSADVIGVTIKVDGVVVKNVAMPTLNGACGDITSLQTGSQDTANPGSPGLLCWAHLYAQLTSDKKLSVAYKGATLITNLDVNFFASPGQLVFAGRTGGANENQHVDNIKLTTVGAASPLAGGITGINPLGFSTTIADSGAATVDPNAVTLQVNGTTVTSTVTKTGGTTKVVYTAAATQPFVSGATNNVHIVFKDTNGNTYSADRQFVATFDTIPSTSAVPSGSVDTSKVGFLIRPYQTVVGNPNTSQWTEEQLAGLHGPNIADLSAATNGVPGLATTGFILWTNLINFDNSNPPHNGNFTSDNGYPDDTIPGSPGPTAANTDNTSEEIIAWVQFPAQGAYTMGVNSDDGFKVTSASNPRDVFALKLGEFEGGRGSSDTTFTFYVPQAGIYPFRVIWENGGGGANLEWFSVLDDGTKVPLNDSTNPNALKAYYSGPALPAYTSVINPLNGATDARPDVVSATLVNGGTTVTSASLTINGSGTSTTTTTSNGLVVNANVGTGLPAGSSNTATLVYTDNNGKKFTNSFSFTVLTGIIALPANIELALNAVDTTKPGFNVHTYMVDHTNGNTENENFSTESLLLGLFGDNIANLTDAVSTNYFVEQGVINYDRVANDGTAAGAGDGNFQANTGYPDKAFPGIDSQFESFAVEVTTYIQFLTAGFYQIGVNSDDSFRITLTNQGPSAALTVSGLSDGTKAIGALSMNRLDIEGGGRAAYGTPPPVPPLTAPLVYGTPGGLDDAGPYPDMTGKIVLFDRNGSAFGTTSTGGKVKYCQDHGAVGVIFATPDNASPPFYAGATRTDITIPVLSISNADAQPLRDAATAGTQLTATFTGDPSFVVGGFNDGRGATDSTSNISVPAAGTYPVRVTFHQGGGGGNFEFYSINPAGQHVLINDTNNPTALKAFRALAATSGGIASHITIQNGNNSQVSITWDHPGVLQASPTVDGTYTDVAGATGQSAQVPITGSARFFRVRAL